MGQVRLLLAALIAVGAIGLAQDTGWRNPSADFGAFSNGSQAYYDDTLYAEARKGRQHQYWGYAVALPEGSTILGIEVRLDVWESGKPGAAYMYVELSWNGGASWTATGYRAGPLGTSEATYILGGPADTWGRSWTPGEFAYGLFRVRLTAACGPPERIRLDWVAVRVYYQSGVALAVSPGVVDLGTLTLADYDQGFRELSPAQRVTVTSGAPWSLYVAAETPTWNYSGPEPSPAKPCEHLEWRVVGTGPTVTAAQTAYQGLTTTPALVATGTGQTAVTWVDMALLVRVDYDTVPPGTYELRFRYTLTLP